MKCQSCGKPIVSNEEWGDYDDACEWACHCHDYTEDYCVMCKDVTIHTIHTTGLQCTECHHVKG